jgi:hypothetical protein
MKSLRVCFYILVIFIAYTFLMVSSGTALTAIQTQEANNPDLVVHLTGLQIRQDVLTLKFRFVNQGKKSQSFNFLVQDCYVLDVANKKKYFPLKDAEGNYLAGPLRSAERGGKYEQWLSAGGASLFWVKFPVPVGNPETIGIVIPGVLPFEGVALKQEAKGTSQ